MRECIVYMVILPPKFTFIKLVHLFFKNHTSHQGKIYNIFTVVSNIHNQKNNIYLFKSKILYSVLLVTLKILLGIPTVLLITLEILVAIIKSQSPQSLPKYILLLSYIEWCFHLIKSGKCRFFLGIFLRKIIKI